MKKLKVRVEAEFTTCIGDSVDGVMETRSKILDDVIDMIKEGNRAIKVTCEEIKKPPMPPRKIFSKSKINFDLCQCIISDEQYWDSYRDYLQNTNDPSNHILYAACLAQDNLPALKNVIIENCPSIYDEADFSLWMNNAVPYIDEED